MKTDPNDTPDLAGSPPVFLADRVQRKGWDGIAHEYFVFTCPLCDKENIHSPEDGHRGSHCQCWKHLGYILKENA
jgi:hypothetical protein